MFENKKLWAFIGGAAAGLFLRGKTARKIAVNGIACGMQTRDKINAEIQSVKEDAADIYEEAKEKAGSEEDE